MEGIVHYWFVLERVLKYLHCIPTIKMKGLTKSHKLMVPMFLSAKLLINSKNNIQDSFHSGDRD